MSSPVLELVRSIVSTASVCALGVTIAAPAFASEKYLPYPVDNYGAVLDCTYCHADNTGGIVTRDFGKTLKSKGLVGGSNFESLDAAIAALGDADTDGDGDTDFDELTQSGNPNDPTVHVGEAGLDPAEYGCVGGTIAGPAESTSSAAWAAAGFVAAVLLWSRRRA